MRMSKPATLMFLAAVSLWAEDFASLKVEELADGFPGAEGPVWSRDGYLLFSDFTTNIIHRYDPGKGVSVFRSNSNGANGNTFDRQGRLYTCEYRSRRVTRTSKNGKIEVIAETWQGKRLNAPNDITVRRDGHTYFTDPLFTPPGTSRTGLLRRVSHRAERKDGAGGAAEGPPEWHSALS
jgi:gluconolactonase